MVHERYVWMFESGNMKVDFYIKIIYNISI
jgi:hypothetical protein